MAYVMELVDLLDMSPICRICRFETSNPQQVGGGFRGLFCVRTEGVPKFWFDDLFCMGGDPLRKKPTRGEASTTKDVARVGVVDVDSRRDNLGLSNLKQILVSNSTGPSCGLA